jgi:multiple sugar transport system permease protein
MKRISLSKLRIHIILIALGIFFMLPFFWMLSTSLKSDAQVRFFSWIPSPVMWSNYLKALQYIPFFTYFKNTMGIAGMDVLGTVITCPLVAYGLSRLEWKGRNLLFILTISVMMIPVEVTMVPSFILFNKLHLAGTTVPLFIQSFFGRPFMIFLLRQFYMGLPRDLEDAARIDGASEFKIYRSIILPLTKTGILTVALFRLMNSWNDFIGPLLYLSNERKYTLTIGLQMFTTQYDSQWNLMMAASLMTTLPIVAIYFFVQKRFIEGITFTGIKG